MKVLQTSVDWVEPKVLFETLKAKQPASFWLDSSMQGRNGRYSFMGSPAAVITNIKQQGVIIDHLMPNYLHTFSHVSSTTSLLEFIDLVLTSLNRSELKPCFPFEGGFVGYVSYEYAKYLDYAFIGQNQTNYPEASFMWVEQFFVFDSSTQSLYACCLDGPGFNSGLSNLENTVHLAKQVPFKPRIVDLKQDVDMSYFKQDLTKANYLSRIDTIQDLLRRGETYEVCLTNRFVVDLDLDPWVVYQLLRQCNPAPYAAFLQFSTTTILSSSPECFFRLDASGKICSEPIKGTRYAGHSLEETASIRSDLLANPKEQAELLMITDLIRNDLAKSCLPGSLQVESMAQVSQYEQILHLASVITAQMPESVRPIDVFCTLFPGGSITGAPKYRTMQWIDQLERSARGVYTGCIGYFSVNQHTEFNIAIRTMVYQSISKQYCFGAGGAITVDSDPQAEWDEMLLKAKPLAVALHQAQQMLSTT